MMALRARAVPSLATKRPPRAMKRPPCRAASAGVAATYFA